MRGTAADGAGQGKWGGWRKWGRGHREVWKKVASFYPDGQVEGRQRRQEGGLPAAPQRLNKPQPRRILEQGGVEVPGEDCMEGNQEAAHGDFMVTRRDTVSGDRRMPRSRSLQRVKSCAQKLVAHP